MMSDDNMCVKVKEEIDEFRDVSKDTRMVWDLLGRALLDVTCYYGVQLKYLTRR